MKEIVWESLKTNDTDMRIAKVPGGWLVKEYQDVHHSTDNGMRDGWDWRVAMTYIPDPEHKWEI